MSARSYTGEAMALLLLFMVGNAYRGRVAVVAAMLGLWQALTAGCSLAYLLKPWPVQPGQGQCSAALDWPLGAVQAWLGMLLAVAIYRERRHGT